MSDVSIMVVCGTLFAFLLQSTTSRNIHNSTKMPLPNTAGHQSVPHPFISKGGWIGTLGGRTRGTAEVVPMNLTTLDAAEVSDTLASHHHPTLGVVEPETLDMAEGLNHSNVPGSDASSSRALMTPEAQAVTIRAVGDTFHRWWTIESADSQI